MRKLIMAAFFCLVTGIAYGQASYEEVRSRLEKVNSVFDSSYFLEFNVKFLYKTDTLYGDYDHSEREAKYVVKGNNFYFSMGDMEFMQNDSFAFTLSHVDKTMMLARVRPLGASSTLPLRYNFDSSLALYQEHYNISIRIDEKAEEEIIEFTTQRTDMPYKRVLLSYDLHSYQPTSIEFVYTEVDSNDADSTETEERSTIFREKTMTLLFSDFRPSDTDFGVFSEERYVNWEPLKEKYIPSEKYKDYQLYFDGIYTGNLADDEEFPEVKVEDPDRLRNLVIHHLFNAFCSISIC